VFVVNTEHSADEATMQLSVLKVSLTRLHAWWLTAAFPCVGKTACATIRRWSGVEQIAMFSLFQNYTVFRIFEITN
jgi:hypothetical protein